MRWFSITPTRNIRIVCRPVSGAIRGVGHDKVAIGGENMATIGQRCGVNQHIFAGLNQTGNVEHLSRRQIIAAIVQRARKDNLAHA
ncbi:Uncharacterised protein [Yersinia aleksiciae]|uniref:Uncharacterized protein n=1 Tax=Yersinia aleksiciae TaxID=263819 RepID=A0A0T9UGA6_YERAE|nr:Uncharacterised protein [Yersinia aleksiciae]